MDATIIISYGISTLIFLSAIFFTIKYNKHKIICREKEIVLQPIEIITPNNTYIGEEEQSIVQ